MKRRPPAPEGPSADEIHRAMLEHLAENPPPKRRRARAEPAAGAPRRERRPKPPKSAPPDRPRLMLRMLRLAPALERLDSFVRYHCAKGTAEIVVVVGKGRHSGETGPVIGPAVHAWCDAHPGMVAGRSVAPPREGGDGALVLRLVPRR